MKRFWLGYLVFSLVLGTVYWLSPYRFTAMSAIHTGASLKTEFLLSEDFQGGKAVLVDQQGAGLSLFIVRKWGPFYRSMSAAVLWPPVRGAQVSSTTNYLERPSGEVVAFAGLLSDPSVVSITAGGQERNVQGERYFLFVWTSTDHLIFLDATAFDANGLQRYKLGPGLVWNDCLLSHCAD